MSGSCFICNPVCGRCKPPLKKTGECPECGAVTIFDQSQVMSGADLLCKGCGADITLLVRPETLFCNYCGLPCAYPCGKAEEDHAPDYCFCGSRTPPEECVFATPV